MYTWVGISLFLVPTLGKAFGLTPEEFQETYQVKKPEKDDTNITFYCRSGVRSVGAMAMAKQLGFEKLAFGLQYDLG